MHKNEEGIVSFGKYTLLGGGDFMMGASCKAKDYGKKGTNTGNEPSQKYVI